uniref:hypothetical protein n=1 Tax=Ningiella ruwaisensis TaxID=2364274 RepID=UPI00109F7B1B|nr:hypothetical protein [Ningiella ruwaisensis]
MLAKPVCSKSNEIQLAPALVLNGQWIRESDGSSMLNPQTSGLAFHPEGYLSISDASADESQIQRLHLIDRQSSFILEKFGPIKLAEALSESCFAPYLQDRPDFEALVALPGKPNTWISVTEDATRSQPLSPACIEQYRETGSTDYPSLLVEITMRNESLLISGVRPVQFAKEDEVGNFPNDGIEGLAVDKQGKLYLGLEKDNHQHARVFFVNLNEELFNTQSFILAKDANLNLPQIEEGNHPINGMDIVYPDNNQNGYLIAAARNDNELWIMDLDGVKPTRIVPLTFFAPSFTFGDLPETVYSLQDCNEIKNGWHKMHNASLEGVLVDEDTLVLINDPWKANYLKNVKCEADKLPYERMSPLIFKTPLQADWFK